MKNLRGTFDVVEFYWCLKLSLADFALPVCLTMAKGDNIYFWKENWGGRPREVISSSHSPTQIVAVRYCKHVFHVSFQRPV